MNQVGHETLQPRVAFTQPYIPAYREPLLAAVIDRLSRNGILAHVFTGGSQSQRHLWKARGDATNPRWSSRARVLSIGGKVLPRLKFRVLPRAWRRADLVVTEMEAGNLNAWWYVLSGQRYVTFGHGASETSRTTGAAFRLEGALNRRARAVLTYTPAGREAVLKATGRSGADVVSFDNTTDTRRLLAFAQALDVDASARFRTENSIPPDARVALFVGSLSAQKRIDLLASAARFVLRSDWWLVVVGDGEDRQVIEELVAESGRVTWLGHGGQSEIANAACVAELAIVPGRIGLFAVDALTLGLPILTGATGTDAPEISYLREGDTLFTVDANAEALGRAWLAWDSNRRKAPGARTSSIEDSAERIAHTILAALDRGAKP